MAAALEILAVVAAAAASLRWPVWALLGLLAAGSVARWARGQSWVVPRTAGSAFPGSALAGVALGAVALGLALLVAAPLLEDVTARAVEWSQVATVRGSVVALVTVAVVVAAQAVAAELVFRRWILDRVHGAGARPGVAIAIAAVAEAAVAGGHLGSRLGAAATGAGLGLLYVGAGHRLGVAISCRITFEVGVLVLTYARVM